MSLPVLLSDPMFLLWGLPSRGISVEGFSVWRVSLKEGLCPEGLCQGDPLDKYLHTVKNGRYASYWNTFLFFFTLILPYV